MEHWFSASAFYVIALLILAWLGALVGYLRVRCGGLWLAISNNGLVLAWSLVLAAGVFALSPPEVKLLSDEADHVSSSHSLARYRTPEIVLRQELRGDELQPVESRLSERPLVFPFLISLVHLVKGYSWRNAFVVNFVVLWALLALGAVTGRRFAGALGAIAAPLLMLGVPGLSIWATSAGYDVLSVTALLLVLLLVVEFMRSENRQTFAFFLVSLALFSHIRMENVVLAAIFAAGLGVSGYLSKRLFSGTWPLLTIVMASVALRVAQIVVTRGENLADMANFRGFGVKHFVSNLSSFGQNLFIPDWQTPYSQALNVIGAIALVLATRPLRRSNATVSAALVFIAMGVLWTVLSCLPFWYGNAALGLASRYFIPLSLGFALAPVVCRWANPRLMPACVLLALALGAPLAALPKVLDASDRGITNGGPYFKAVREMIGDASAQGRRVVVIGDVTPVHSVLGYESQMRGWARANEGQLLTRLSLTSPPEVYLVYRGDAVPAQPLHEDLPVTPRFKVEFLGERRYGATNILKVWRIVPVTKPVSSDT